MSPALWWECACFFFSSRRRHTRCSRDWSSDVCSSDLNPHALRPSDPDAVLREQILVFHDARFEILAEALDVLFESVVSLVLQPADAEGMGGQARPAILFKNFQNLFAFAEAVEERRKGANVQGMRAEPQEMAGDSLQLRQDGANHAGTRRRFHDQQFFNGFAISQAAADGCDIVHAVDIGSKLLIGAVLRDFFHTSVQIPDDALPANNALAVN